MQFQPPLQPHVDGMAYWLDKLQPHAPVELFPMQYVHEEYGMHLVEMDQLSQEVEQQLSFSQQSLTQQAQTRPACNSFNAVLTNVSDCDDE